MDMEINTHELSTNNENKETIRNKHPIEEAKEIKKKKN